MKFRGDLLTMSNWMGLCAEFLLCQRSLSTTVRSGASFIQSSLIKRGSKSITSRNHIHILSHSRVLCRRQQLLHRNNRNQDRHSGIHQGSNDYVIRSPYPDSDIPDNISLPHFLMNKFQKYSNLTALVDGTTGQETTYSQLQTSVAKVTSALVKLGLSKGDVVTIFSPNCPQFTIATIAIGAAGAIFSPVNPSYTTGELKHAMNHVKSRFLITTPALLPVAQVAVQQCPSVKEIIVFGEGEKCRPFSSLLEDDMSEFPENIDFQPEKNVAALPFSSGTTGLPKAVMLSHYNLIANIIQMQGREVMGYEAGVDCLMGVLPFFHIYGLMNVMNNGLSNGAKLVILPSFQPASYLETIQKYRVTYLHIAPPLLLFLAKQPMVADYNLSSIRNMFVGAAPSSADTINELLDRFQNQLIFRQGYGLTEASPLTHSNAPENNKYHTVGLTINNTHMKVVDIETRESLGPGKRGEVCIRGPQVMIGYYENDKATSETIVDGWLLTGDVGHYDDDHHTILSDRIKELIKVKGFQVAPAELEAVLLTHPLVLDAAVVGKKDEKLGEAPKAYVVLRPKATVSAQELHHFVEGKVAPFKKLAGGIEFRSEIPKSPSGKILRRILREEANSN